MPSSRTASGAAHRVDMVESPAHCAAIPSSAVASSGLTAGAANSYVDAKDKKVLAHTKLVGGGEKDTITFPTSILKKGGAYSYECTMPGHNSVMHGVLKFG